MKKWFKCVVAVLALMVFATVALTGCGGNDTPDPTPTPTPTPTPAPTPAPAPTPEPAPPVEQLPVPTGDLVVQVPVVSSIADLAGLPAYTITHNIGGVQLDDFHDVRIGWDGVDQLFVSAVINNVDPAAHNRPIDNDEWWEDDTFEIFLVPFTPQDEAQNRAGSWQWTGNANNIFTTWLERTADNTVARVSAIDDDGVWTLEWTMRLGMELVVAINERGILPGQIATSLTSGNALLGSSGGAFWSHDNLIQFNFERTQPPFIRVPIINSIDELDGTERYLITRNTAGAYLEDMPEVRVGWDGRDTMFVSAVLRGINEDFHQRPADNDEWWEDDTFEIFLISAAPLDELGNRSDSFQWSANANVLFPATRQPETISYEATLDGGVWRINWTLRLDNELVLAINDRGHVYGQIASSVSAGNALLGATGGFWAPDNLIRVDFETQYDPFITVPRVGSLADLAGGGTSRYLIIRDINGNPLDDRHEVRLGWNGTNTMFVSAVLYGIDEAYHQRPADNEEWWEDDTFEVFLIAEFPEDEATNRGLTFQWSGNANVTFTTGRNPAYASRESTLEHGIWRINMALTLDPELTAAINANGYIYGQIASSVSAANALLGATGLFWVTDNMVRFYFE